ncbi:MAG: hypothetical protein HY869_04445 [Chloroflexi bacterium]|nr:hypothetical protein [Chloroflexota bacterium]
MKRDLRDYAKRTEFQLAMGAIVLFLLVGMGLIWLIYGSGAASLGMLCMGAGLATVVIIYLVFIGIEWILKSARPK